MTFTPHGFCLSWDTELLFWTIMSNLVIAAAYFIIPVQLFILRRRHRITVPTWFTALFMAFIFSCGAGHLFNIAVLWFPVYWLQAIEDIVTAVFSYLTVIFAFLCVQNITWVNVQWFNQKN
jgi:hypothetical protein